MFLPGSKCVGQFLKVEVVDSGHESINVCEIYVNWTARDKRL